MLQVKYKSKPFIVMSETELAITANVLLAKIAIITGWLLPEENLKMLVDAFYKKLVLSYPNCNVDEVVFAFLTEGSKVKDWGKYLNIGLIDEVMEPYLQKRFEVSKLEEQIKNKTALPPPKEDLSDKAMQDWFKDVFKNVEQGKLQVEFIPVALYDWMDKNGNIPTTASEKKEYLVHAVDRRLLYLSELATTSDNDENKTMLENFLEMKRKGEYTGKEILRLKNLAKQLILLDLLREQIIA